VRPIARALVQSRQFRDLVGPSLQRTAQDQGAPEGVKLRRLFDDLEGGFGLAEHPAEWPMLIVAHARDDSNFSWLALSACVRRRRLAARVFSASHARTGTALTRG